MGLTMSFYHIQNRGFTPDGLKTVMKEHFPAENAGNKKLDMFRGVLEAVIGERRASELDIGALVGADTAAPTVAFSADKPWLPFYDESLCDGAVASSGDAMTLSKIFGVPVLSFAAFDSDVLFVSFADGATGETFDHAKPNFEEFEEFDDEQYSTDAPLFLGRLGADMDAVAEIWQEEVTFAEERMEKLCGLIGAEPYFMPEDESEGYDLITG